VCDSVTFKKTRERWCTAPKPAHGGKVCYSTKTGQGHNSSPDVQTEACAAVDGGFGAWGAWSACDSSNNKKRERWCTAPKPAFGGKVCYSPTTGQGHNSSPEIETASCSACASPAKITQSAKTATTSHGIGTYQQWDNFMHATWACDKCSPGTTSTMRLHRVQTITGWKRQSGGISTAQQWRLEGSMTNSNFKTICSQNHLHNDWQACDGSQALYVRLVKVAGGGGPWNGPVELKGCADESAGQCVVGALETDNTGYTTSLGTSHSSDAYQQWNQFLSATWACDACGPGTHSTIALDNAQKITGWKRSSGGFSSAQKWHLETSMSANSGFKTSAPARRSPTTSSRAPGSTASMCAW
jgi:hypothetical protein